MSHDGFTDKGRRNLNLSNPRIDEVLPQYFTTQYPKFISLLERYYEFETDSASPTELIGHLFESRDINQTDLSLLSYIEDELLLGSNYAEGFQDKRAAANFSSQLFRAKGTKYSIEWFFRAFFGVDPEIFYPKENVFLLAGVDSDTLDSKIGTGYAKYITNDKLYQTFALEIKTELGVEQWENIYKLFAHPAGMYLGSRYVVNAEAEVEGLDSDIVNNSITTAPSPVFNLSADDTSPDEGDLVTFTISGSNIPSEYYYWYVAPSTISDSDIVAPYPTVNNREPVLVTANSGSFDLVIGFQDEQETDAKEFLAILSDEPFPGAIPGAKGSLADQLISINDVSYTVNTTGGVSPTTGPDQDVNVLEGETITFTLAPNTPSIIPNKPVFFTTNLPNLFVDSSQIDVGDHDVLSGGKRLVSLDGSGGSTNLTIATKVGTGAKAFVAQFEDSSGNQIFGYSTFEGILIEIQDNVAASYTITASPSGPSEGVSGTPMTFNVTGSGLNIGDSATYINITHLTTDNADFTTVPPGNSPTSRALVTLADTGNRSGFGQAVSLITVKQDAASEGEQTFKADLYDDISAGSLLTTSGTITITDTNFTLTPTPTTVNEGDTVTFDVSGTGITQSGTAYWQMDYGTADSADFINHPSSSGDRRAVSITSGSSPEGSFTVNVKEDFTTDGAAENFATSVWTAPTGGVQLAASGNVTINDTSIPTGADYNISATGTTEGGNVVLSVSPGASSGDTVDWTIDGVGVGDSATSLENRMSSLTGTFGVVSGTVNVNVGTTLDSDVWPYVNNGRVIIDINGGATGVDSDRFTVSDAAASYELIATNDTAGAWDEGSTTQWAIKGKNIDSDTVVYVEFSGGTADGNDFATPNPYQSRQAVSLVSANFNPLNGYNGTYSVAIENDATTEGNETFNASLWNQATSGIQLATAGAFTINDTSTAAGVSSYVFFGRAHDDFSTTNNTGSTVTTFRNTGSWETAGAAGVADDAVEPDYTGASSHFDDEWLSTGGSASDYQIRVTGSFGTYSSQGSGSWGSWQTLSSNRAYGINNSNGGSGLKIGASTLTITIKRYTGTLGVGDTVLTKLYNVNCSVGGL